VLKVELKEFFGFPSLETTEEMRDSLAEIARTAPEPVIRELVPLARNLMGRKRPNL
jgi:hypothetical protein